MQTLLDPSGTVLFAEHSCLKPWQNTLHQKRQGVTAAMPATTMTQAELREEYRILLGLWSEARALYPADSPEVERASEELATLELQLQQPDPTTSEPTAPALEAQR